MRVQADWKIVERGWQAHVLGEAEHKFPSALEAVKKLRVRHTLPPIWPSTDHTLSLRWALNVQRRLQLELYASS